MSLPVVVNPLAEGDLRAGFVWCEQRGVGLGIDFLLRFEEVIERIGKEPEWYGREFEEIRVAPLRRHQFAMAYRIDATQVTVVAVYHVRSDPREWQSRP